MAWTALHVQAASAAALPGTLFAGSAFHTQHKSLFEEVQATMLDVRSLLCKEASVSYMFCC